MWLTKHRIGWTLSSTSLKWFRVYVTWRYFSRAHLWMKRFASTLRILKRILLTLITLIPPPSLNQILTKRLLSTWKIKIKSLILILQNQAEESTKKTRTKLHQKQMCQDVTQSRWKASSEIWANRLEKRSNSQMALIISWVKTSSLT